ncbi:MAG: hypothetical protein K2X27_00780 [Candidatus Obscuribacterales bacterium]|nr:hypothetical protein [Candidatus Obscuribacterales bacterium]
MDKQEESEKTPKGPEAELDKGKEAKPEAAAYDPLKLLDDASKVLKNLGGSSSTLLPGFELKGEKESSAAKSDKENPSTKSALEKKPEVKAVAPPEQAKPGPLDQLPKELRNKVIDKITDTHDPVAEIKSALLKLDNLQSASVTMNGRSSHIEINLKQGQSSAAPNISVRGFRPVASHIDSHLSFDLTPVNGGVSLSNMNGFSGTVQGPLGRLRHSETNSMFIGKDAHGSFVTTSSDLYMRRRVHSSTTTLREGHFPVGSPMRSAMQHPESFNELGKTLRLFQGTEDLSKMGIQRSANGFDLHSEAKNAKHVELNFKPENAKLPLTVKSIDLEKNLSASLAQQKDSVSLEKISGIQVNVDFAGIKASVCPSKLTVEKDRIKMELRNPKDGQIMPVEIPISKLKEAAAAKRKS